MIVNVTDGIHPVRDIEVSLNGVTVLTNTAGQAVLPEQSGTLTWSGPYHWGGELAVQAAPQPPVDPHTIRLTVGQNVPVTLPAAHWYGGATTPIPSEIHAEVATSYSSHDTLPAHEAYITDGYLHDSNPYMSELVYDPAQTFGQPIQAIANFTAAGTHVIRLTWHVNVTCNDVDYWGWCFYDITLIVEEEGTEPPPAIHTEIDVFARPHVWPQGLLVTQRYLSRGHTRIKNAVGFNSQVQSATFSSSSPVTIYSNLAMPNSGPFTVATLATIDIAGLYETYVYLPKGELEITWHYWPCYGPVTLSETDPPEDVQHTLYAGFPQTSLITINMGYRQVNKRERFSYPTLIGAEYKNARQRVTRNIYTQGLSSGKVFQDDEVVAESTFTPGYLNWTFDIPDITVPWEVEITQNQPEDVFRFYVPNAFPVDMSATHKIRAMGTQVRVSSVTMATFLIDKEVHEETDRFNLTISTAAITYNSPLQPTVADVTFNGIEVPMKAPYTHTDYRRGFTYELIGTIDQLADGPNALEFDQKDHVIGEIVLTFELLDTTIRRVPPSEIVYSNTLMATEEFQERRDIEDAWDFIPLVHVGGNDYEPIMSHPGEITAATVHVFPSKSSLITISRGGQPITKTEDIGNQLLNLEREVAPITNLPIKFQQYNIHVGNEIPEDELEEKQAISIIDFDKPGRYTLFNEEGLVAPGFVSYGLALRGDTASDRPWARNDITNKRSVSAIIDRKIINYNIVFGNVAIGDVAIAHPPAYIRDDFTPGRRTVNLSYDTMYIHTPDINGTPKPQKADLIVKGIVEEDFDAFLTINYTKYIIGSDFEVEQIFDSAWRLHGYTLKSKVPVKLKTPADLHIILNPGTARPGNSQLIIIYDGVTTTVTESATEVVFNIPEGDLKEIKLLTRRSPLPKFKVWLNTLSPGTDFNVGTWSDDSYRYMKSGLPLAGIITKAEKDLEIELFDLDNYEWKPLKLVDPEMIFTDFTWITKEWIGPGSTYAPVAAEAIRWSITTPGTVTWLAVCDDEGFVRPHPTPIAEIHHGRDPVYIAGSPPGVSGAVSLINHAIAGIISSQSVAAISLRTPDTLEGKLALSKQAQVLKSIVRSQRLLGNERVADRIEQSFHDIRSSSKNGIRTRSVISDIGRSRDRLPKGIGGFQLPVDLPPLSSQWISGDESKVGVIGRERLYNPYLTSIKRDPMLPFDPTVDFPKRDPSLSMPDPIGDGSSTNDDWSLADSLPDWIPEWAKEPPPQDSPVLTDRPSIYNPSVRDPVPHENTPLLERPTGFETIGDVVDNLPQVPFSDPELGRWNPAKLTSIDTAKSNLRFPVSSRPAAYTSNETLDSQPTRSQQLARQMSEDLTELPRGITYNPGLNDFPGYVDNSRQPVILNVTRNRGVIDQERLEFEIKKRL